MQVYTPAPAMMPTPVPLGGRRRGTCKFFNSQKGYGFILDRGDGDVTPVEVFCHYSAIAGKDGFRSLAEGEEVEYDVLQGPKGYSACNVTGPHGRSVVGDPKARVSKLPPNSSFSSSLYSLPPAQYSLADTFASHGGSGLGGYSNAMSPYQHHVFAPAIPRTSGPDSAASSFDARTAFEGDRPSPRPFGAPMGDPHLRLQVDPSGGEPFSGGHRPGKTNGYRVMSPAIMGSGSDPASLHRTQPSPHSNGYAPPLQIPQQEQAPQHSAVPPHIGTALPSRSTLVTPLSNGVFFPDSTFKGSSSFGSGSVLYSSAQSFD